MDVEESIEEEKQEEEHLKPSQLFKYDIQSESDDKVQDVEVLSVSDDKSEDEQLEENIAKIMQN